MRLLPSDPDIGTIITRIENKHMNLQPDFQRGEVWSRAKKQRLIDSILRDWHVPPIHVIELSGSHRQEVLDGQQRLAAIRDFARNEFPIDGTIEPIEPKIANLEGKTYREMPDEIKRQFNQFSIRIYRIVDYNASEPSELFFRLNQPTNLTSAEQRNAFFGEVRRQIKELVSSLDSYGLNKAFLGFSNSRMAYDDVFARVALSVERGSISDKIGSADLVDLYRSTTPISQQTESTLAFVLELFGRASKEGKDHPKFNKATLYSWLIFVIRAINSDATAGVVNAPNLARFMEYFEHESMSRMLGLPGQSSLTDRITEWLFQTYSDRSTSRVADVSSVLLRDFAIWMVFAGFAKKFLGGTFSKVVPRAGLALDTIGLLEGVESDSIAKALQNGGWGTLT